MSTKKVTPPYAGSWDVPEGVTVAWGARLIITQDGQVDQVWDRQGITPDDGDTHHSEDWYALQRWLGTAGGPARITLGNLLRSYALSTRETREVVLYEDIDGIIRANPRSSAGYCYVIGYLKPDTPVAAAEHYDTCGCTFVNNTLVIACAEHWRPGAQLADELCPECGRSDDCACETGIWPVKTQHETGDQS